MSNTNTTELPNVSEILRPLLQRIPPEQQPLLISIAERMAAERYRGWSGDVAIEGNKSTFINRQRRSASGSVYADQ